MTLCHFIRADGHPCAAPAGKDSQFCFHHDPARSLEAKKARLKGSEIARIKKLAGGDDPSQRKPLKTVRLNSLDDIRRLLASTINEFRSGQITADEARVLAYVANILIGAIKDGEIEIRLSELETRIKERALSHDRF